MSGGGLYFDKAGEPIEIEEFVEKCEDDTYRTIGYDIDREHDIAISTVWLGVRMNLVLFGPPLIFETMVFGAPYEMKSVRYCRELDAIEGHRRTVEDVLARRPLWYAADEEPGRGQATP